MKTSVKCLIAMSVLGLASSAWAQESEKKVKLDQLSAPVKEAVQKAVGKGKIVDIGEIRSEGKTSYEIEFWLNGKEIDIILDSKGMELGRNLETAKDSDKEADEKKVTPVKVKVPKGAKNGKFQDSFDLEHRSFSTSGRNRYFILEPGHQLILEGKDGKDDARLEINVLDETKDIGGIQTRVVEERETVNDQLVEVSRNFFAICKDTNSVFYFGEEVDIYRDSKIVNHDGAWLHGQKNARAGMMMPGECLIGAAYYQEYAPKTAMDRARIEEVNASLNTAIGTFSNCLKVWEENPLDGDTETKTFAPGIGLIQDEGLLLVKHGFINK